MSEMSDVERYTRGLIPKRQGHPLWYPNPPGQLPPSYREVGVQIGDIGYFSSGAFNYLFNIMKPSSHPDNPRAPPDFTPYVTDDIPRHFPSYHPKNARYSSQKLQSRAVGLSGGADIPGAPVGGSVGVHYWSSHAEGSTLILPEGGHRFDAEDLTGMAQYAFKHALSWFKHLDFRRIPATELVLVTGCDKVQQWGVATYFSSTVGADISFDFCVSPVNAGSSFAYSWSYSSPITGNISDTQNSFENQCVFIRGFNISRKVTMWIPRPKVKLLNGAEKNYCHSSVLTSARRSVRQEASGGVENSASSQPERLGNQASSLPTYDHDNGAREESPDSDSSGDSAQDEADYFPYYPGQILNMLFLQHTTDDVEVAIIHDSSWFDLSATDLEVLLSDTICNATFGPMKDLLPGCLLPSYQVRSGVALRGPPVHPPPVAGTSAHGTVYGNPATGSTSSDYSNFLGLAGEWPQPPVLPPTLTTTTLAKHSTHASTTTMSTSDANESDYESEGQPGFNEQPGENGSAADPGKVLDKKRNSKVPVANLDARTFRKEHPAPSKVSTGAPPSYFLSGATHQNHSQTHMDVDEPPAGLECQPLFGGKVFPTKRSDYGFKVLAECVDPIVDIILIHGLDGHRLGTFTEDGVCWPRDLLPAFCPQARIATYGYNAATEGNLKQLSAECIFAHGQTLLAELVAWRKKTKTTYRPIVFIAYSIGGLVLKHALIRANDAASTMVDNAARIGANGETQDESDIIPMDACLVKSTTYGIIFLGTPHQGVPFEDLRDFLKNLDAFAKKAVGNDVLLHSEQLYNQLDSFANIGGDFDTKLAYEVRRTILSDGRVVILVPKATAVLPGQVNTETIGMEKDHLQIATFTEKDDSDFETLTYWLQDMIRKAPARVERNFAASTRVGMIASMGDNAKKMSIFQDNFSGPRVAGRFGGMDRFAMVHDVDDEDHELRILSPGDNNPAVDIIIVHGLHGHLEMSFQHDNGTCWIKTLLPHDLPNARIMTYGYDASMGTNTDSSIDGLFGDGHDLLASLCAIRKKTTSTTRPIIFLAHSSGGLVVKHTLIKSSRATLKNNGFYGDINRCTYGIIFLGTPHQGVELDHLVKLHAHENHPARNDLTRFSNHLAQQIEEYKRISHLFKTKVVYETEETQLPNSDSHLLVSKHYAIIAGAQNVDVRRLDRDHHNLVKYSSAKDKGYKLILEWLTIMISECCYGSQGGLR